jgi:hypothetical protein
MNLLLLPKELQVLISEFNVHHRSNMKVVMNELLINHQEKIEFYKKCCNCDEHSDEEYSIYIMWRKFHFCGVWCQYDTEKEIRKRYKK